MDLSGVEELSKRASVGEDDDKTPLADCKTLDFEEFFDKRFRETGATGEVEFVDQRVEGRRERRGMRPLSGGSETPAGWKRG